MRSLLLLAVCLLAGCVRLTEPQREAWKTAGRSFAHFALEIAEGMALNALDDTGD